MSEDVVDMDNALRIMPDDQIRDLERGIASIIAQDDNLTATARLLRSNPEIGPVSVAMLIAEMTELGWMTAGEAAAMTGLAPTPHDSGTMRGKRRIVGGRRALRHVVKRLEERSKPHKLIIIAIARRLLPIANAVLKTATPWRSNPIT